jgi:hypothetical protein
MVRVPPGALRKKDHTARVPARHMPDTTGSTSGALDVATRTKPSDSWPELLFGLLDSR